MQLNPVALALTASSFALVPRALAPSAPEATEVGTPIIEPSIESPAVSRPTAPPLANGSRAQFALVWDDTLDGTLDAGSKVCRVELSRIDDVVTGRFVGTVLGEERTATFTGEVAGSMLMLQQREPGYVCAYQLTEIRDRRWAGTWRDSQGRRGTVALGPLDR